MRGGVVIARDKSKRRKRTTSKVVNNPRSQANSNNNSKNPFLSVLENGRLQNNNSKNPFLSKNKTNKKRGRTSRTALALGALGALGGLGAAAFQQSGITPIASSYPPQPTARPSYSVVPSYSVRPYSSATPQPTVRPSTSAIPYTSVTPEPTALFKAKPTAIPPSSSVIPSATATPSASPTALPPVWSPDYRINLNSEDPVGDYNINDMINVSSYPSNHGKAMVGMDAEEQFWKAMGATNRVALSSLLNKGKSKNANSNRSAKNATLKRSTTTANSATVPKVKPLNEKSAIEDIMPLFEKMITKGKLGDSLTMLEIWQRDTYIRHFDTKDLAKLYMDFYLRKSSKAGGDKLLDDLTPKEQEKFEEAFNYLGEEVFKIGPLPQFLEKF
jgi:hypothetical protein